jgi:hypothetical protein
MELTLADPSLFVASGGVETLLGSSEAALCPPDRNRGDRAALEGGDPAIGLASCVPPSPDPG